MDITILSFRHEGKISGQDQYRMTYNGRILGDDRGYTGKSVVVAAIMAKLEKDAVEAKRYDRPLLYAYVAPRGI